MNALNILGVLVLVVLIVGLSEFEKRSDKCRHQWGYVEDGREEMPTQRACMKCGEYE